MLLLDHLGQLRASYGPEQFQKYRSHTKYGSQGVDNFSKMFGGIFWYWKSAWSWWLILTYRCGWKQMNNSMVWFGLIWRCRSFRGNLGYLYGWMRSKVKIVSHHDHINFHFQTNKKTNSEKMANCRHNIPWDIAICHKLPFELEPNECLFSHTTYIIRPI